MKVMEVATWRFCPVMDRHASIIPDYATPSVELSRASLLHRLHKRLRVIGNRRPIALVHRVFADECRSRADEHRAGFDPLRGGPGVHAAGGGETKLRQGGEDVFEI